MKKLIILILSLFCLCKIYCFSETPSDKNLKEALFSPYIYNSVNVITGEYCEAQTDLQIPGSHSLSLRRVYDHSNGIWHFNQPTTRNNDTLPLPLVQLGDHQLAYEYDTQNRLVSIKTLNKNGDKTFGFLHFHYSTNQCDVETSNGNQVTYVFNQAQLESTSGPNKKACRYLYTTHPTDSNKKLISRREEHGTYCEIEYYDKNSPSCGKVQLQKIPSPEGTAIIMNRFVYHEGSTDVYDALENKIVYRYSPEKHLTAIEQYDHDLVCRTERFYWDSSKPYQMIARALINRDGGVEICRTFAYDTYGNIIKETLFGNLTGQSTAPLLLKNDGEPVNNGVEHYSTHFQYTEQAPYLLIKKSEDNGNAIHYLYHPDSKKLIATLNCDGDHIHLRHFYAYDTDGFLMKEIMDDGCSSDMQDLSCVTERHIKSITPCQEMPVIGLPAVTEERYLDLKTKEERLLKRVVHSYSPQGKIIKEEVCDTDQSSSILYSYDDTGLYITIMDAKGKTTHNHYDNSGNLIGDDTHTHTYNALNQLVHTKEVTVDGNTFSYAFQYDNNGHKIASINHLKQITQHEYDALGRLICTTHPLVLDENDSPSQFIETFEYDSCDRIVAHTDHSGTSKHTCYNARGKPIDILYADGTCESFVYHLDGTLQAYKTRNDITTVFHSDFLGRATTIQLFDKAQRLLSTASATFNSFHQLSSTDPTGKVVLYSYDSAGRPITNNASQIPVKEEEKSHIEKSVYDSYYDSVRDQHLLRLTTTDSTGHMAITTYDALNRLESVTIKNSFGQTLSSKEMRYDADGNKVKEIYWLQMASGAKKGMVTKWEFFPEHRLKKLIEFSETPQQTITSYDYDRFGRLISLTKPDGVVISYQYDGLGRVQTFKASDKSFCYYYMYDALGNVIQITDAITHSISKRSYNAAKQITSEQLSNGLAFSFTFDDQGRRVSMLLPDSSAIKYDYDAANLSAIHRLTPSGKTYYTHQYTSYNLDGKATIAQLIHQLGTLSYIYDMKQKCTKIDSPYWSQAIDHENNSIKGIATNDAVGQATTTYTYDDLDQVASEEGAFNHSYTYDSLQNRISKNKIKYKVSSNNQLSSTAEAKYTYDLNGCLIKKVAGKKITEFSYDALNRLVRVSDGQSSVVYTYDAFGRRLTKKAHNNNKVTVLSYLYDGMREIGAADASGKIVALRVLDDHAAEAYAAISCEIEGKVYAPIHDCQGSICCLIDVDTKKVAETYRYSAFGEMEIFDSEGKQIAVSAIKNPWRFAGKRYDEETGLLNFGKRLYEASAGRWLTPDPLGYADGPNRYLFVHNNPLNNQDLYGLFSFSDFWNDLISTVSSVVSTIAEGINQVVSYLSNFSYLNHIHKDMEIIGHQVLGKTYFAMVGYYVDYPEKGIYGNGEFNNHVRITAINGILNLRENCTDNVRTLSEVHGGINIHYVFHPTEGWTWDLIKGFLAKCGYVSPQAKLLAQTWKELIQEMGGVNGGGKIIHYAHSIGGTNTDIARSLLTPDEQKMIRVITIGSATMIANEGFDDVVNYVSRRDGVSGFGDPFVYLHGLCSQDSNILYVGSHWGMPFIDHLLTAETYRMLLEMLGQDFIKNYKDS